VFALQVVQQLSNIKPSDSPPALHLQQPQESSDFLWLVLLVLGFQMQQQQQQEEETTQHEAQQQQQQAAAVLLGSSAHQLWQQQHFWRQHSSTDDLSRTLHVLEDLLQYWREQQPSKKRWEVLPELAGPGLQLLQHLPVQLLQLAGMSAVSSDVGSAGPASTSGRYMPGRAAFGMFELALDVVLPCPYQ
jgi:type II secretory pathway pseudopilin PulG